MKTNDEIDQTLLDMMPEAGVLEVAAFRLGYKTAMFESGVKINKEKQERLKELTNE